MCMVLVLNGPNLNLLGTREPELYGTASLDEIRATLSDRAARENIALSFEQYNDERQMIAKLHQAPAENTSFLLLNPAAYTHSSIALRDALAAVRIPFVEVHLSNVYRREPFRRKSLFADLAVGVVAGFGKLSYSLAFEAALDYLRHRPNLLPGA